MPATTPVSVVVGDNHPVFRSGMARELSASGQVVVLAEAQDGRESLEAIRTHDPDVAVLDLRMPGLDGIEVAHAVTRDQLRTRVLILSAFTDSALVYRALEQGATGYLPKEASTREILEGVLACARGDNVLPAELAGGLADEIRRRRDNDAARLTDREAEVLRLIAQGKSLPTIAAELYLGTTTVKTHAGRLYEKLGVSDRAAAVAEAMRQGLLE